ncbi:hypothetical protein RRG08_006601 [Elysia crispata]|uniref:Uncharacterized protein n=1 Tax=Elysia crispata TaxID=231223 RepID=A0AAE0YW54_9GAST|nr:hypothetical protein RRG08_006601 [Elysia crispata]
MGQQLDITNASYQQKNSLRQLGCFIVESTGTSSTSDPKGTVNLKMLRKNVLIEFIKTHQNTDEAGRMNKPEKRKLPRKKNLGRFVTS